ncbi:MAG: hypothetical protein ACFWTS_01890 [Pseudoclavibacter caeni]|jgi:hypothetical protein
MPVQIQAAVRPDQTSVGASRGSVAARTSGVTA